MNKLQKVELDLFLCVKEICDKFNINYFLVCGSALGAMRHGGFIPWDDDFDIGMYRDDYERFLEIAPKHLPKGLFLQNYKSDPSFPYVFSKLRNSNTTFIQPILANLNINHGIYIDIFPLDGCPKSIIERKKLNIMKKNYLRQLNSAFNMPVNLSLRGKITVGFFKMLGCHKRTGYILRKYENLIKKYTIKDSDIVCNHGTWYGDRDYILKEYYGKGTEIVFEGITVRIPEKCDEYLSSLYGDWRTPPPKDKQVGSHFCEVYDTEIAYTEYIRNVSRSNIK